MKHLLLTLLLLVFVSLGRVMAQSDIQKIESQKIGYITNRLNLTTEQAPPFWAIYNEYNGKKKELNRKIRQLIGSQAQQGQKTDSDVLNRLKEVNGTKHKLGDLDDEYMSRFLKVISPTQLQELYKTERDFNRMLLEKLNSNQD